MFYLVLHTDGAAVCLPHTRLNAETQDDGKLYEITLFSVCGDSIFAEKLQTEISV